MTTLAERLAEINQTDWSAKCPGLSPENVERLRNYHFILARADYICDFFGKREALRGIASLIGTVTKGEPA